MNKKGLTLIELLLSVSLTLVLSIAVFRVFTNFISIWDFRMNKKSTYDIEVFYDRLSNDLRNMANFSNQGFSGEPDKISWLVHDTNMIENKNEVMYREGSPMYRVEYSFDYVKKNIERKEYDLGEIVERKNNLLYKDASGIEFTFYVKDLIDDGYKYIDVLEGNIPYGIMVRMIYQDSLYERKEKKKYFEIPLSYLRGLKG